MDPIYIPPRTIILPDVIDNSLKRYATLEDETMGAMFYRPHYRGGGLILAVAGLLMTGVGTPDEVFIDPQIEKILYTFLSSNPGYKFIDVHTHTDGNANPSEDDYETFAFEEKKDPHFIGMVVSNKRRSIYPYNNGKESKILTRIVPADKDYYERERTIFAGLEKSASELGHTSMPDLLINKLG